MSKNLDSTSRFLSLILRHKPETIGIELDEHGWADVESLINGISRTHEFNMDVLEEIVRTDNKQRYSFNEEDFIEYLNTQICKEEKCTLVEVLGWDYNRKNWPEKYRDCPHYNF